jgi:nitronate monooxygenase
LFLLLWNVECDLSIFYGNLFYQIVAALALGASGVQIGTRFNATQDCTMFPSSFKTSMVNGGVKDTAIVLRSVRSSSRVFLNQDAREVLNMEQERGSQIAFEDISKLVKFERLREGMQQNDSNKGLWNCGQSICLIDDIPTVQELMQRLIKEANEAFAGLVPIFGPSANTAAISRL